jgi:adenylate cyclase
MVDDLQWADTGSISLLFHLCRNLAGSRILILGAYRPEEVAIGRAGERHPLAPVINELQREFGDITIDLNQAQDRAFIDAVLDSEPNRLGGPFRDMLYSLTRGHPLFTIELLRGLQERRDLVQNAEAEWIESSQLNFETLPARVEAVIGERIDRLDQSARDTLRVASVEGEVFTAGVIAQIQSTDVRELIASLSGDLDRRHHIVRAHKIKRVNAQRISCYRFRNYLFQKYLYDLMDEVERAFLHEDVGNALEDLYGEHANEIAVQLAWHFGEAGIAEKAIRYLIQAGEQAVHLSAYQEAIAHLENGMEVLNSLPASLERDQLELDLQLALGIAWVGPAGFEPRVKQAFTRAHELAQLKGQRYQLCRVLGELSIYHYVWAEHQKARDLAEEALSLAQRINDPLLIALQNSYLGFTLFAMGEYSSASEHFKVVMDIYKPEEHHRSIISLRGSDTCLTAYAYMACCLWCLGYPDQAEKMSEEVLSVTRNLGHPFTLIDVLCFGGCLFNSMRRDADLHIRYAIEFKNLANEKLHGWLGQAIWQHGEALAMMGHLEEGIAQMKDGIYHRLTSYERCYQTGCIRSLAEAQAQLGDIDKGLAHIDEALSIVNKSQEQHSLADIYRTRAEILLMKGDKSGAEEDFLKAIKVARQQQAKSWELRATIGLARLWNETGKGEEARQMLVEIYNWFTEGFDTPDLKEAEALIEQLA